MSLEVDGMAERKRIEDFHSESVQEIMGTIPSWITRWGVTVIFGIFVIIFIGCCLIRYPQTIASPIVITSSNPPSRIAARFSGLLDTVTVANGGKVRKGDLIALLSTPARYDDVLRVRTFVDDCSHRPLKDVLSDTMFRSKLELGDIQALWTEAAAVADEYERYLSLDLAGRQTRMTNDRISKNKEYYEYLVAQRDILLEDITIQRRIMDSDSILLRKEAISEYEFQSSRQSYLSKLNSLTGFESSMKSAQMTMLQLFQSVDEIELQRLKEENDFYVRINQCLQRISAQVDVWFETYAIVAPMDGIVSLQDYWSRGQHVNAGDVVASVVPDAVGVVEGRMRVSSMGFGKVVEGQEVNVRLNGFPYMEFGILKGSVSHISSVPEKDSSGEVSYTIEVSFPKGLVSTYGKTFPMIQEMDGTAEIITEDMRLAGQLLYPIKSLFMNR